MTLFKTIYSSTNQGISTIISDKNHSISYSAIKKGFVPPSKVGKSNNNIYVPSKTGMDQNDTEVPQMSIGERVKLANHKTGIIRYVGTPK